MRQLTRKTPTRLLTVFAAILTVLVLAACGGTEEPIVEAPAEGGAVDVPEGEEITTPGGTTVIITEQGDGVEANPGDVVSVHYRGTLQDGTVFDSSYERGEPIVFPLGVGRVIPGWDEGIAELQVGDQATLIIPADQAYGDQGAGDVIPPGATLIFEVELVDVNP